MVKADEKYERSSTLSVARGLHVFRYLEYQGVGAPAIARVVPPADGVTLLEMPGHEEGLLLRPGDCVAICANRSSEIVVGLRRGVAEGSLDASFRLEALSLAEDASLPRAMARPANESAPGLSSVSFSAHLANHGDVPFDQNVWAGGPDAPAIFEGIELLGEGGAVLVEMQVLVAGRPSQWSDWVGARQFAGTRGRGLPLLGLRLRLTPSAGNAELAVEALFLGALVVSKRGREVEFVSGSGVDPLVGLKVSLQGAPRLAESQSAPSLEALVRDREPRVRVFRASLGR